MREKKKLISRLFEKKNWRRVVQVLSCMVVFCTTYALILPAITQEARAYCGTEAHEHSAECYEKILSCTKEEHQHDDSCRDEEGNLVCVKEEHFHNTDCFREVMNCQKQVHQHSLICYSDPYADLETSDDWVRSLPKDKDRKPTTRENVIDAALSQENVKESDRNYQVDNETEIRGITRYGQWDGSPYLDDWSGAFVRFLLHYSGVSSEKVHPKQELIEWMNELNRLELLSHISEGKEGDIVFINNSEDEIRAGLILSINKDERTFTAMMGDWGRKVSKQKYSLDSDKIHSVFKLPVTDDPVEEPKDEDTETNVNESESVDKNITDNNDLKPEENSEKKETNNDSSDEPEKNEESDKNQIKKSEAEKSFKNLSLKAFWDTKALPEKSQFGASEVEDPSEIEKLVNGNIELSPRDEIHLIEAGFTMESDDSKPNEPVDPDAAIQYELSVKDSKTSDLKITNLFLFSDNELLPVEFTKENDGKAVEFEIQKSEKILVVCKDENKFDFEKNFETEDETVITAFWNEDAFDNSEDIRFIAKLVELNEDEKANLDSKKKPIPDSKEKDQSSEPIAKYLSYDISFFLDSNDGELVEVEPKSEVKISVDFKKKTDLKVNDVWHHLKNGTVETLTDSVLVNESTVEFRTDSFSTYTFGVEDSGINPLAGEYEITSVWSFNQGLNNGYRNFILPHTVDVDDKNDDININAKIKSGQTVTIDLNGFWWNIKGKIIVENGGKLTIKNSNRNSDIVSATYTNSAAIFGDYNSYSSSATTVSGLGQIRSISTSPIEAAGGELNIEDVSLVTAANTTVLVINSGSKVNLKNTYICESGNRGISVSNGVLEINGGAVSRHGKSGNFIPGAGIFASNSSTVTLKGGAVISDNRTDQIGNNNTENNGGGICVDNSTLNIFDASVNANATFDGSNHTAFACGGGVKAKNGAKVYLYSPTSVISGNFADNCGGGISLSNDNTQLYMFNGQILNNTAEKNEGGGISLQALTGNCQAILMRGTISGNKTKTSNHWGGGGIFCGEQAKLILPDGAYITNNTADVFGGGLAGCSTGKIAIDESVIIAGNHLGSGNISDKHTSGQKKEDQAFSQVIKLQKDQAVDYFTCYYASVFSKFGSESAMLSGNVDGNKITNASNGWITSTYCMGLTSGYAGGDQGHKLLITDNSSNMHGGGVLINGIMVGGEVEEIYNSEVLSLNGSKVIHDKDGNVSGSPDGYEFEVWNEMVNPKQLVSSGVSDASGEFTIPNILLQSSGSGTLTYILREGSITKPGIQNDQRYYRIEVQVSTQAKPAWTYTKQVPQYDENGEVIVDQNGKPVLTEKIVTVHEYDTKVTKSGNTPNINVYRINEDGSQTWIDTNAQPINNGTSDHTVQTQWQIKLNPDGNNPTFVNIRIPGFNLSVEKEWSDAKETHADHKVTVSLFRAPENDPNNEQLMETVELNSLNSWTYSWKDLPSTNSNGIAYKYWVDEIEVLDRNGNRVSGYQSKISEMIEVGNSTGSEEYVEQEAWVKATSLDSGGEYILVDPNDNQALSSYTAKGKLGSSNRTAITRIQNTENGTAAYSKHGMNAQILAAVSVYDKHGLILNAKDTNIHLLGEYTHPNGLQWTDNYGQKNDLQGFELRNGKLYLYGYGNSSSSSQDGYVVWKDGTYKTISDANDSNSHYLQLFRLGKVKVGNHGSSITTKNYKITVTNTKIICSLKVIKVDEENQNKKLQGAEFSLYSDSEFRNLIETKTTNEQGELVFENLQAGVTYYLKETKAPAGYELTEESISTVVTPGENGDPIQLVEKTVKNKLSRYELPETGGSGTKMFKAAGSAMIIVAATSYGFNRKKKRKEGED